MGLGIAERGAASPCYRVTRRGATRLASLLPPGEVLSGHAQDVLNLCRSEVSLSELGQFLPPRALDGALKTLLALGLIERAEIAQTLPSLKSFAGAARPATAL
jgi:hypothetical protein